MESDGDSSDGIESFGEEEVEPRTDPLSCVRRWVQEGSPDVDLHGKTISIAGHTFNRDEPTAFRKYNTKDEYYTLVEVLFFAMNMDKATSEYTREALAKQIGRVSYLDHENMKAYVSDKIDYCRQVDQEKMAEYRAGKQARAPATKKQRLTYERVVAKTADKKSARAAPAAAAKAVSAPPRPPAATKTTPVPIRKRAVPVTTTPTKQSPTASVAASSEAPPPSPSDRKRLDPKIAQSMLMCAFTGRGRRLPPEETAQSSPYAGPDVVATIAAPEQSSSVKESLSKSLPPPAVATKPPPPVTTEEHGHKRPPAEEAQTITPSAASAAAAVAPSKRARPDTVEYVFTFPEPVVPPPIKVQVLPEASTPEERAQQAPIWLPFALWAAVCPSSGLSITIPVIENGELTGLLLDLHDFNWMYSKLAGIDLDPKDVPPFPEDTLREVFKKEAPFQRWPCLVNPDRVIVVLRPWYINFVARFEQRNQGSRAQRDFHIARDTLRARCSTSPSQLFEVLGSLDLAVHEKGRILPSETGMHPLCVSISRRFACRVEDHVTKWTDWSAHAWTPRHLGVPRLSHDDLMVKWINYLAKRFHLAGKIGEPTISYMISKGDYFCLDEARRIMPVRL